MPRECDPNPGEAGAQVRWEPGLGHLARYVLLGRSGTPGAGFEMELPGPDDDDPEDAFADRPDLAERTGARILVVEDDPMVASLIRRFLEGDGHEVLVAREGREALDVARGVGRVDCLLVDVVLPGIDGVAVGEELRRLQPGLPVVLMSGYAQRPGSSELLADADAPLLEKPFTRRQLRAIIRSALRDGE